MAMKPRKLNKTKCVKSRLLSQFVKWINENEICASKRLKAQRKEIKIEQLVGDPTVREWD